MKSASNLFFLSVFALWATRGACSSSTDSCSFSPNAIIDDGCVSYATLDRLNVKVKPAVDDLVRTTDFFSHYRMNLFHKTCPFWNDEDGMCGNIACAVETLDNEEDIPEIWRAHELSKLEGPRAKHPGKKMQRQHPDRPLQGELGEDVGESCVVEYDDECDDRDYCVMDDEGATSKGDYVSLLRNPERFTGYGGQSSKQVWDAIYLENCFKKSSFPKSADLGVSHQPTDPAVLDFKQVLDTAGRQAQLEQQRQSNPNIPFVANTGYEGEDECLEKRVFYRVVSGMHASISVHLCWDFLNQSTGEWQPNLACYESRLHGYPDRISNLYFNYALVTRAVAKLAPYVLGPQYTFCTGDPLQDQDTRDKVSAVTQHAASVPQIFDESVMFVNGEGPSLKEDFRNRFRNISRVMDCVGCDKCRLWGKIQTNGYGTALKVLFEFNEGQKPPSLKRTEVVALFNTYARLSSSISAVGKFRAMIDMRDKADEKAESQTFNSPEDVWTLVDEVDQDMNEFIRMRQRGTHGDTVGEQVGNEFARVMKAVKIVLKSWIRTPRMIWEIVSDETMRVYRAWIGLPPRPRRYAFRLPKLDRDEL